MCKLDKISKGEVELSSTAENGRGQTFLVSETAAPKINDLDSHLVPEIQQNVLRLQVTMDNVLLPQDIQAGQQLPGIPEKRK